MLLAKGKEINLEVLGEWRLGEWERRLEIGCVILTCAIVIIRSLMWNGICFCGLWFQMTLWLLRVI